MPEVLLRRGPEGPCCDSMKVNQNIIMKNSIASIILCVFAIAGLRAGNGNAAGTGMESKADGRGIVRGVVSDAASGEPLPFAAVQITGTSQGTVADFDGSYSFELEPGLYDFTVSFTSYKSMRFSDVRVAAGQETHLDARLESSMTDLKEVKITAKRVRNTDAAVVSTMKQADVVATGASAQLISRAQSKDAAEVVSRLPGVSMLEGGMMNVRGLGVRYNSVVLNGTTAPGTENDSRAFSLDVIAGNAIDHLMLYKTASAEFPADFSGGMVSIITKGMPQEDGLQVSYSIGVNTASIGKDFQHYRGHAADAAGFGAYSRRLPAGMPSDIATLDNSRKAEYSREMDNDWSVRSRKALPSQSFSFQWDKTCPVGKEKNTVFGSLLALNYGYEEQVRDKFENSRFGIFDRINEKPTYLNQYTDEDYATKVKLNALANFGLAFSDGSRLEFKNIFSQNAQNRSAFRQGVDYNNEYHIREQEYVYTQRTLYVGQLLYAHAPAEGHKLDYRLSYALTNRQEPDRRLVTFRQQVEPGLPYYGQYKASDVNRFYQAMSENMASAGIDYKGRLSGGKFRVDFLSGLSVHYRFRDFSGRRFVYTSGFPSRLPADFLYQDLNAIFSEENLSADGYFMDEDTRKSDAYAAMSFIPAAYAAVKMRFAGFQANAGVRAEFEKTVLDGYSADGAFPVRVDRGEFNLFPSLNLSYSFHEKHLLRAAYAYTVNRPELREIAPYVYYDFDHFADYTGNPDLRNGKIQNADLRYEFYPSSGEIVSVGAFYKYFVDPIEVSYIRSSGGSAIYTFKNADFAYSYGVEVEIRKSLDFMKMKDFSVVLNAAWIASQVRFSDADFDRDRAMQGQSPFLVNAGLFYEKKGWTLSLLYQVNGKRILAVGEVFQNPEEDIPDIYEMPRHELAFGLRKAIGEHWEIKFLAGNLLDQPYRECQFAKFTANDGSTHTVQQTPRSFKLGMDFQIGVSYKM